MENTVLGNALEGVPEESSEEGEKQNDSKIESADNLDGLYLKSFVCWLKLIVFFVFFSYILKARHHICKKKSGQFSAQASIYWKNKAHIKMWLFQSKGMFNVT